MSSNAQRLPGFSISELADVWAMQPTSVSKARDPMLDKAALLWLKSPEKFLAMLIDRVQNPSPAMWDTLRKRQTEAEAEIDARVRIGALRMDRRQVYGDQPVTTSPR